MNKITIELAAPMLYDRLHSLSAEFAQPIDTIVSLAVKQLIDDIEVIRDLRIGKVEF